MTAGSRWTSSGTLGDLPAVIEHGDPVAEPHHQLHVVLDQEQGRAVRADAVEKRAQRPCLGRFMPAAGSSRASRRGSVASARAISSRR